MTLEIKLPRNAGENNPKVLSLTLIKVDGWIKLVEVYLQHLKRIYSIEEEEKMFISDQEDDHFCSFPWQEASQITSRAPAREKKQKGKH